MVTLYASVQILNAERLNQSCERLVMPTLPEGRFLEAVKEVVKPTKTLFLLMVMVQAFIFVLT